MAGEEKGTVAVGSGFGAGRGTEGQTARWGRILYTAFTILVCETEKLHLGRTRVTKQCFGAARNLAQEMQRVT